MTAEPLAQIEPTHHLDLSLISDGSGRTYIGSQYVAYPFHLCRALRTLGDPAGMPTLYIQSCSGGLFEGEDLRCRVRVGRGARAHITTAASTIVHSMTHGEAALRVDMEVEEGGFLEYLPDPLILFPQACLRSQVNLRLAPAATVLLWDSVLAHDPRAAGRTEGDGIGPFTRYQAEMNIHRLEGGLLARDRFHMDGTDFVAPIPGVMGTYRTQAGFALVRRQAPQAQWVEALRAASSGPAYVGISALPQDAGVWVRILAPDAVIMRQALASLWSTARQLITGQTPAPRRK